MSYIGIREMGGSMSGADAIELGISARQAKGIVTLARGLAHYEMESSAAAAAQARAYGEIVEFPPLAHSGPAKHGLVAAFPERTEWASHGCDRRAVGATVSRSFSFDAPNSESIADFYVQADDSARKRRADLICFSDMVSGVAHVRKSLTNQRKWWAVTGSNRRPYRCKKPIMVFRGVAQ